MEIQSANNFRRQKAMNRLTDEKLKNLQMFQSSGVDVAVIINPPFTYACYNLDDRLEVQFGGTSFLF